MTKPSLSKIFAFRIDIMFLFDVILGNPNGDPDAGNSPRIDEETSLGLVSDACTKRKIRDMISILMKGVKGFNIFIASDEAADEERILNKKRDLICEKGYGKSGVDKSVAASRKFMCDECFDVRAFGAVMSTGKDDGKDESGEKDRYNAGKVTGPLQVSIGRSVDPIVPVEFTITRKCVAAEKGAKSAEEQIKKSGAITGTMGHKNFIHYGLYSQKVWYSPFRAERTGFSLADLQAFLKALVYCFGQHRTASSGQQSFRGAYVFVHEEPLGSAHDNELFATVDVAKNKEVPRAFEDYDVAVLKDKIPNGVTLHEVMRSSDVDKLITALAKL